MFVTINSAQVFRESNAIFHSHRFRTRSARSCGAAHRHHANVYVIGIGACPFAANRGRVTRNRRRPGGALDPALRAGDLVLDTPIPGLPAELPWHVGGIHTVNRLITTPADKAALFRKTGALAVDMEQAVVQRAVPAGVEIIGLRAISDPADMAVDPAVLGFINEFGRPRPLVIGKTLLRRPSLLPQLLALGQFRYRPQESRPWHRGIASAVPKRGQARICSPLKPNGIEPARE